MSRAGFTRRLEALEGNAGSRQSALVRVPKQWSEARRKSAIDRFRASEGIHARVPIDVQECDVAQYLEVLFIGCWADTLKHIAKHGKRIGE
jgi:hypothetical protein